MQHDTWLTLDAGLMLGIAELDQQHLRIVHILNNLNAAVKQSHESSDVTARLYDEMVEYVRFHFRNEERMMEKLEYPDELAHTIAHLSLLDEVMHLRTRFINGEEAPVLQALKDWVVLHISSSDKRLADFLNGHASAQTPAALAR